jgi:hypothetical protein
MKKTLYPIAAAVLLLCVLGFTYQTNRAQYEYRFVDGCTEKKANELGSEGWELVAAKATGAGVTANVGTFIFKRQK